MPFPQNPVCQVGEAFRFPLSLGWIAGPSPGRRQPVEDRARNDSPRARHYCESRLSDRRKRMRTK